MATVLIALGSNHRQRVHLQWASERLASLLDDVRFSRLLWTPDIHGSGLYYLNRLAWGRTALTADALERELKLMEREVGRNGRCVTLDLDLMQYDTQRYHLRDWPRPYIQQLLPDVL